MSFGHILDQKLLYSTLTETYYSITSYSMAEHSCTLHADVNGDVTISLLMADDNKALNYPDLGKQCVLWALDVSLSFASGNIDGLGATKHTVSLGPRN